MIYLIIVVLVSLSGLFSGLTLGLLSLDKSELKRKIALGDRRAEKVYSIRKNGNLLLTTFLLGNVAVNSTLAIFLSDIATGLVAGLIATGLIVVFGEIIPQATFSRHALVIGAKTVWLVKIFIIFLLPIAWPIAWILDKILGEEMPTVYSKKELIKIVEEHEDLDESEVDRDEERIIKGALTYSDKKVSQIMTPKKKVFILKEDIVLDDGVIRAIKKKGHTRLPVYDKSPYKITGILYVKDLIGLEDNLKIGKLAHQHKILRVSQDLKLDELLNKFVKNRLHMAIVENKQHEFVGVTTLEDVIEEVLDIEIIDETDVLD